jgi:hypothetical protein
MKKNYLLILHLLCAFFVQAQTTIPSLQSRPSAPNVFYLDFDGQVVNNPIWYSSSINALPANLTVNQTIECYNYVAEAFIPFNINVTTSEAVYNATPATKRYRCVITPTNQWYGGPVGGVAALGGFGDPATEPAWAFTTPENQINIGTLYPLAVSHTIVHELGHILRLSHNGPYNALGIRQLEYHPGKSGSTVEVSWGPFMGNPRSDYRVQFVQGPTTPNCTPNEDNFKTMILPSNIPGWNTPTSINFLPDDIGNTIGTSKTLTLVNNTFSDSGIIGRSIVGTTVQNSTMNYDEDFFQVVVPQTSNVTINCNPWSWQLSTFENRGAVLHVRLTIYNSAGSVISRDSSLTKVNVVKKLQNLAAGTYYIAVGSSGNPNYTDFCYGQNTRYGSVGRYYLTGSIAPNTVVPTASFNVFTPEGACTERLVYIENKSAGAVSYSWNFGSGASPATSTLENPTTTYNTGGTKTITLTATNANGSSTTTRTVTIGASPIVSIVGPFNCADAPDFANNTCPYACMGDTITLVASASGSTPPYAYQWRDVNPNVTTDILTDLTQATLKGIIPDLLPTAIYTVVVTSAQGCSTAKNKLISKLNNPVTIIGSNSLCTGQSTLLYPSNGTGSALNIDGSGYIGAVGFLYNWSNGKTTPSITVNTGGTYNITVTTPRGCVATGTKTVLVANSLNVTLTAPNAACFGVAYALTTNFSGLPGYSYIWNNGATTATLLIVPTSTATYSVTVTSGVGCSGVGSKTVTLSPLLGPVTITPSAICSNTPTTLTASASGGVPPYYYNWQDALLFNPTTGSTTTTTALGNISVRLIVTDGNGCQNTATNTIIVQQVDATISGPTSICPGETAVLSVSSVPGGGIYQWSNGSTSRSINVTTAGTYNVTVRNAFGPPICIRTGSRTITSGGSLGLTISGSTSICSGQSTTLTANSGASPPLVYNWSSGATTQSITVSSAGTYTVTVTGSGGCSGSTSQVVQVGTTPTVNITGDNSVCAGNSTVLTASGATTYLWSVSSTATSQSIVVSPTVNTTYSVTGTTGGCSATATFPVTVTAGISTSISGTNTLCTGQSTSFTASPSGANYTWSGPSGFSATTQTITATTAGTYSTTVTDGNGCSGTSTRTLTVNPRPTINVSGNNSICTGQSTTLTASGANTYAWNTGATGATLTVSPTINTTYTVIGTNSFGCTGSTTYTVAISSGITASVSGTNSICSGQNTTFTASGGVFYSWNNGATTNAINISTAGTYTVTVVGSNGCTAAASRTLTVNAQPSATITGPTSICNGSTTTYSAPAGLIYIWSTSATTQSITVSTANTYTLTVTDGNSCTASSSKTLTINANPTPTASSNSPVCINTTLSLSVSPSASAYSWTGPNSFTSSIQNPTISNAQNVNAGSYSVTITDGNGCTGSTTTNVIVSSAISITANDLTSCSTTGLVTIPNASATSYSWSPTLYVTPTGGSLTPGQPIQATFNLATTKRTYVLTVTASGCVGKDTIFTQRIVVPSSASTSSITQTSATITWSSAGDTEQYQVRYRKTGSPTWITVTINNANNRLLTGLQSGSQYQWQVRAKCNRSGTTVWSSFSKYFYFTTSF